MQFPKPNFEWSGTKFRQRYGLGEFDFWDNGQGFVVLKNGIVLPDDPPIFETPDPAIPAPPGIWVHEMKSLNKRVGDKLIDGESTSCFHIVVDAESKLSDPWLVGISIAIGSTAYLMDKSKTVVWDGTKWK